MKMRVVRVVWRDAHTLKEVWHEDLKELCKLAPYDSVGFLIEETEETLVLAMGVLPKINKFDETVYRNVLIIPKSSIEKITELKEAGCFWSQAKSPKPKRRGKNEG